MVKPRVTALSYDVAALIDAYTQEGFTTDCEEEGMAEHIEATL